MKRDLRVWGFPNLGLFLACLIFATLKFKIPDSDFLLRLPCATYSLSELPKIPAWRTGFRV